MSGVALLSVSLSLCFIWMTGGAVRSDSATLRDVLEQNPLSLNDMFRELEELMEDTQHILEEAVNQITTETEKSLSLDQRSNAVNGTKKVTKTGGGESISTAGDAALSHTHMDTPAQGNNLEHECVVDEDCGHLKYCLYEIEKSKCLPCIPTDMPCTKDEQCCTTQKCVWGQCTVNATRGSEGTICQGQMDCRSDLCCAFQREFLFPVCNPKLEKGESCWNHPNLLMDMLAWDQEGPRDHCPCADGLQCQPHGRGSVCGP
ncbi:dickkopf-related protein 3b [Brachionichthys hirsutus]|uniref:dickkopf-related protein 3b n=1 Tax=Brachionichthys hirsutus TaxID=412623 RepID=UPI00360507C6